MARSIQDKNVRKNLRNARKVEKHELLDDKELAELNQDSVGIYEKLKKLLRPSWFVRDTDQPRRKK